MVYTVRPGARPRVRPVAAADAGVRGRVITWSTGDGVAGAELTFARPDGSVLTVTAGAGGGFAVPADDRTYTLAAAEAVGFLPYAPAWQHSPVRLVPRPELQVEGFTIYLFPALDYQGTVVDAAGAPVAGAAVRMLGAATGEQALAPLPTAWVTDASTEGVGIESADSDSGFDQQLMKIAQHGLGMIGSALDATNEQFAVVQQGDAPVLGGGIDGEDVHGAGILPA